MPFKPYFYCLCGNVRQYGEWAIVEGWTRKKFKKLARKGKVPVKMCPTCEKEKNMKMVNIFISSVSIIFKEREG